MPKEELKTPSLTYQEIKKAFQLFFRFNRYILRYWKLALLLLILGNLSLIFSLINPYLGKVILDKGVLEKNLGVFIKYTILSGISFLFIFILTKANSYLSSYVIRKVKVDLIKQIFKKMSKLSLSFFQNRSTGELIFRINNDINNSADIITNTLPNMILTLIRLFYITLIILFINYQIFIFILIYHLMLILRSQFFIKRNQAFIKADFSKLQDMYKILSDFFSHIYFIKASGKAGFMLRRYLHLFFNSLRLQVRNLKWQLSSEAIITLSHKAFFGLVGFLGTLLVIKGKLTLGSLGAIIAYLNQGAGAYGAMINSARQIIINRLYLERVSEILDAEIEVKEKKEAKKIFLEGKIEFRQVTFFYEKDKYILDKLSFIIPSQAKIALVGKSGSGKTTIINLILRLYDVWQGLILLDNYDICDLKFKSLYNQIGVALQEPFLFNASVKENISFYKKTEISKIITASKIACADSFIQKLPYGYDTVIGENAYKISQGQKQRLAIARAVFKRSKILILDEAMSSLDSETEDKIVENIKKEFQDSTVIIVSHRLSTVKKMDLVYFLANPSCMYIGTHQELLANYPEYKNLFASQIEPKKYPDAVEFIKKIPD